jgi:hypothetical protein
VANAYNNQGLLGPSGMSVVVNNFDSSPISHDQNQDVIDMKYLGTGGDGKKQMMTPHHAMFGTN